MDSRVKIKGEYVLREIGGDYILIPIGKTALEMNGMITMDEVGVTIWHGLEEAKSNEEILRTILDNYDVQEEVATADMKEFMDKLLDAGLVEE